MTHDDQVLLRDEAPLLPRHPHHQQGEPLPRANTEVTNQSKLWKAYLRISSFPRLWLAAAAARERRPIQPHQTRSHSVEQIL